MTLLSSLLEFASFSPAYDDPVNSLSIDEMVTFDPDFPAAPITAAELIQEGQSTILHMPKLVDPPTMADLDAEEDTAEGNTNSAYAVEFFVQVSCQGLERRCCLRRCNPAPIVHTV